jgi:hypothetical protein
MRAYAIGIAVSVLMLLTARANALTLITPEEAAMPAGGPQPMTVPV